MDKLIAKTADAGLEKHVPVVEENENGITVAVGSIHHPMTKEHNIAFIEVLTADQVLRAELKPEEEPQANFHVDAKEVIDVRAYCNIHGLWSNNK